MLKYGAFENLHAMQPTMENDGDDKLISIS
jgi:hypothetical protein